MRGPVLAIILLILLVAVFLAFRITGTAGLGAPLLFDRQLVLDTPFSTIVSERTTRIDNVDYTNTDAWTTTYGLPGCVVADIGDVRIVAIGASSNGQTRGSLRVGTNVPREHLDAMGSQSGAGTGDRALFSNEAYETTNIMFGRFTFEATGGVILIDGMEFPVGEGPTFVFLDESGSVVEATGGGIVPVRVSPVATEPTPDLPETIPTTIPAGG